MKPKYDALRRLVLVRVVLAATVFCSACVNTYSYSRNPTTGEVSFTAKSWRKFGEFHLCQNIEGIEYCVKAIGVDRQTAGPLEQAAAEAIRAQIPNDPQ